MIFFGTEKQDCMIKTREMFSFLFLINNSVTIGLDRFFISNPISSYMIKYNQYFLFFYLDCICQYFYNYYPYHLSIQ